MLVLSRKAKQQILIGDNIVITIVQVKGQAVRVGIEAPQQMRVLRSEIAEAPIDSAASLESEETNGPKPCTSHAGRSMAEKSFSSPLAGDAMLVGESSGLYPRIRLRRGPHETTISSLAATQR